MKTDVAVWAGSTAGVFSMRQPAIESATPVTPATARRVERIETPPIEGRARQTFVGWPPGCLPLLKGKTGRVAWAGPRDPAEAPVAGARMGPIRA